MSLFLVYLSSPISSSVDFLPLVFLPYTSFSTFPVTLSYTFPQAFPLLFSYIHFLFHLLFFFRITPLLFSLLTLDNTVSLQFPFSRILIFHCFLHFLLIFHNVCSPLFVFQFLFYLLFSSCFRRLFFTNLLTFSQRAFVLAKKSLTRTLVHFFFSTFDPYIFLYPKHFMSFNSSLL